LVNTAVESLTLLLDFTKEEEEEEKEEEVFIYHLTVTIPGSASSSVPRPAAPAAVVAVVGYQTVTLPSGTPNSKCTAHG
jgi:hypothetical protein